MLPIKPFELYSVVTGTIRLDGGAMFGIVPKVLWEKVSDVDDRNRILLATRTVVAVDRSGGRVILVDTGCGSKWVPEEADRYGITVRPTAIDDALSAIGLSTEAVTDVVITHLHFDHNGGLTDWFDDPGGRTQLRYPQARHWVHRQHWEHAHQPHAKDRPSFLKQDFSLLADAGVLEFIDGDQPASPFEGIEWFVSHGHTPFQLHPIFGTDAPRLLFIGDIVPTVAHLRLSWVMAYDLHPLTTIDEKRAVYRRWLADGLLLAFPHDREVGGVALDGTIERPIVARTLAL
ncbi:MAG: MBL fold metallo-hydrolase [Planctomycetes bacterium]|nr:MBL fold metallo-hydrolase [Planctomycetota bacterium]